MAEPARSVRYRLLAIALLPTLVILPLFLGVTMYRWSQKFDRLLITKVNSDLTVAQQHLAIILQNTGERIDALGRSQEFAETRDPDALLGLYRARLGLDYLYVRDEFGRVVAASPHGADPAASGPEPGRVPPEGAASTIDVFSPAQLAALSPDLAARAEIAVIPAAGATPAKPAPEARGMVAQSAVRVTLPGNGAKAIMVGGTLLNHNLAFIDTINDLIYQPGTLPEGSHGTATLFLDDLRISTNVRLPGGERAIGTRASIVVRDRVLGQGQTWLDRAYVVNDWYISAYSPISDSAGRRVGMLYVGFLEQPFAAAKRSTLLSVLLAFLAVTGISVPVFLRWAGGVFRPLEQVSDTIAKVRAGNLAARTGVTRGADEIAAIAVLLDDLLARLQDRDRSLRAWNDELNLRVDERTAALRQAVRELETTTHQLVQSEKLAALGEITAGIAHEINNPLAVMQGNLDALHEILGEDARAAATEFRLLDEQIHRISQIVTRLLGFARADEDPGTDDSTDPVDAAVDCEPLVRHMLVRGKVGLRHDGRSTRPVRISRIALQQVLINLIVNAVHAMPEGGDILISTEDADRGGQPGAVIRVSDSGTGIPPGIAARIFDPFVTTRGGSGGTGLGLSICRRLIERAGGTIGLHSTPGQGTTFTIWLPAD